MSVLAPLFVVGMGVALLIGVSAYIDYQREKASTPIDEEVSS